MRREHDAYGRARVPVHVHRREPTLERGVAQHGQVGAHAREDRLRLRIAEAAVELEHLERAVGGHHQARVQEAEVGRALGSERPHRRPHHLVHRALVHRGRDHRRGRVGTHPAGVRARVAVAQTLVVLRGGERQHVRAVHHGDEARFLAVEEFLDHHLVAGLAEATLEHRAGGLHGFLGRGTDHHALAGSEAIGLHHERRLLCAHPCRIEALARERAIGGRGDAVALEEILGECFRAFELRREAARAKAAQAGCLEGIDHAEHQRPLGADDGQVDLRGQRVTHEAVDVLGGDVDVAHPPLERRAGVARRDVDLRDARRLRDLPRECVLAAAGTDDENFHVNAWSARERG